MSNQTLSQKVSLASVIATYQRLNYPVFVNGDYNVNLCGIRSLSRESNHFDDIFCLFYRISGSWHFHQFPVTLDPGLTYLQTPFSPEAAKDGTFIIAPGFYRGLWAIGKFKNRQALLQVGTVRGYRDKNWDHILDLDPKTITSGNYGILFHPHFQGVKVAQRVWNSSAGCVVPQSDDDFEFTMAICNKSARIFGNKFSFAVIHEEQLVKI
jgi:hypothetical protein